MPLSHCTVSPSLKCEQFIGIIVNNEYFFSKDDLTIIRNVHAIKTLHGNLMAEDKWFERLSSSTRKPCSSFTIHKDVIQNFKNLIQEGRENFVVDNLRYPRLLYADLSLLAGQRWLSLQVIETFVTIFNNRNNSDGKAYTLPFLTCLSTEGKLNDEMRKCKDDGVDNITVIANVGIDKLSNTFIASSKHVGTHWVCFAINISASNIYYCDPLGWKKPAGFLEKIDFLIQSIIQCYQDQLHQFTIESLHCEDWHKGKIPKKCNQSCFQNAPFQGPNNEVCGVVSLIATFLTTKKVINHASRSLPDGVEWLNNINSFSDYERYVLMKWYLDGKANIDDILVQPEPNKMKQVFCITKVANAVLNLGNIF